MNDLIERQSVLNACEQSINILEAVDRIMDLPSVEQEPKTEQEDDYFRKIVEVAISQLRADRDRLEDELAKREQEPCEDAISRTDVLEAISELNSTTFGQVVSRTVRNLPPVKPQVSCGDAVSRQAALDAMYELCNTGETLKENPWRDNPHIDAITDVINNLPPVNPQEPKIGHWIYDAEYSDCFDVTYKCSCCEREINVLYEVSNEVYKDYPYCHCGAKMVEEQERENKE